MKLTLINASPIDFYIFFHIIPHTYNTNIQRTMEPKKSNSSGATSSNLDVVPSEEMWKALQGIHNALLANYTLAENTLLETSDLADDKLVERQLNIGITLSILRGIGWTLRRILTGGLGNKQQQLKELLKKLLLIPATP